MASLGNHACNVWSTNKKLSCFHCDLEGPYLHWTQGDCEIRLLWRLSMMTRPPFACSGHDKAEDLIRHPLRKG